MCCGEVRKELSSAWGRVVPSLVWGDGQESKEERPDDKKSDPEEVWSGLMPEVDWSKRPPKQFYATCQQSLEISKIQAEHLKHGIWSQDIVTCMLKKKKKGNE